MCPAREKDLATAEPMKPLAPKTMTFISGDQVGRIQTRMRGKDTRYLRSVSLYSAPGGTGMAWAYLVDLTSERLAQSSDNFRDVHDE